MGFASPQPQEPEFKMADTIKRRDREKILEMPSDEIIGLVKADHVIAANARTEPTQRNRRYRKMYFQKEDVPATTKKDQPQSETSVRAKNYLPIGRAFVDTARSMISASMFSQDPNVHINPQEKEDEKYSAAYQDLFQFQASRGQMNLKAKFEDEFIFQACLYDFVVGRSGWLVKKGYVPYITQKREFVKLRHLKWPRKTMKVQMIPKMDAIDRPDFEVLNTLMCYPDPRSTDFDNARYFIYLQDTNKMEMSKLEKTKDNPFGIYRNVDKIEPNSYPGLKASQETQGKDDYTKQSEADLVQLTNYYTPDAMVVIANDKWVVRKKPMPGYPFTKGTYCQPDHQWSGIGLLEGMEMLQIDINQLIRLRRDNINFIVNTMTIINKTLFPMEQRKDWRMWPGRTFVINQGDPNKAIAFPRPPDTTQNIFQDINFDLHMTEKVTRVSENAMAAFRQGRRTATEAGLVAQGTETMIGDVSTRFEDRNIVDIVNMTYNLNLQHLTDALKYRILGKAGYEFKKTGRLDILHKGAFDIRPVGTKFFGNKQLKDNQFLQATQIVSQNPAFMQLSEMSVILREIWSRAGEKDPDRFIKDTSDTDYMIPPEIENEVILGAGHSLKPGNKDVHPDHIAQHTEYMETGDYPPEFRPLFEEHIGLHSQAEEQMSTVGGQPSANIPQSPENVMGQPFQTAGGMRVHGGGVEGGTPPSEQTEANPWG